MSQSSYQSDLSGRRVLVGVSGGIAAYKAVDLVRKLRERDADVRVVMTRAATEFVGPLSFQAVSGHRVHSALLDEDAEAGMGHIELARWADWLLVAPATADTLARLAAGRADDLLTTVALATAARVAVAPAMNQQMWAHPATQDNLSLLRRRGVHVLGPGHGDQACGDVGAGRMLEPIQLVDDIVQLDEGLPDLNGVRVLISAGPTYEDIDPVRYIGNRSSGRMGYALARAACLAGAEVTLVSGPVRLSPVPGAEMIAVRNAAQMHQAVMQRAGAADIYVGSAAVADYTIPEVASAKIKKTSENATLALNLERTSDILAEVGALREGRPFVVGFAAETNDLERHARGKLERKRANLIAANLVGCADRGFDACQNEFTVFGDSEPHVLQMSSKLRLAAQLWRTIEERRLRG